MSGPANSADATNLKRAPIALVMDQRGMVVEWSPEAEAIFGYPRREAVGVRLSSLIIPARNRDAHEAGLRRFMSGGPGALLNRTIEIVAVGRDGNEFRVEILIGAKKTGDGFRFPTTARRIA